MDNIHRHCTRKSLSMQQASHMYTGMRQKHWLGLMQKKKLTITCSASRLRFEASRCKFCLQTFSRQNHADAGKVFRHVNVEGESSTKVRMHPPSTTCTFDKTPCLKLVPFSRSHELMSMCLLGQLLRLLGPLPLATCWTSISRRLSVRCRPAV